MLSVQNSIQKKIAIEKIKKYYKSNPDVKLEKKITFDYLGNLENNMNFKYTIIKIKHIINNDIQLQIYIGTAINDNCNCFHIKL